MRRFRFPLERLARVRGIQEAVARADWAAADQRARAEEQRARDLVAARDEANRQISEAMTSGTLDAGRVDRELRLLDRYGEALRLQRERARTSRFQADQARRPYDRRRRDVRGLERLEARQRERWRAEQERLDDAAMNEVALRRALHEHPSDDGDPR